MLVVASNTASFLWPQLVDRRPLLLLAMNAQNRYLTLVTNSLDAWEYYLVGTLRLLAPDPFFYLIGAWYGARAITWMERRTPGVGQSLRALEQLFVRARYVVVFVAPNNPVCLLAGVSGMAWVPFLVVSLAGTIARLALFRIFGDVFSEPIGSVTSFVGDNRLPLMALSGVALAWSLLSGRRKGRGDLEALRHLDDDLGGPSSGRDDTGP
ncbi:MAG: VTT domain-containing protein [Actinobacteria bacterium]|nr:VTT domain-containing protein [Actinomycetota bacterium]